MGMKRAICFVLSFAMFVLCGCDPQEDEVMEKVYFLTEMVVVDAEGEVLSRMTYSYDERGLVTGYEIDDPITEKVWDDQEMVYLARYLPCDGSVDRWGSYAYDDHGNLVDVTDEWFLYALDGRRIDYAYDRSGRIKSYTMSWNDWQLGYDLEYDDEVVRCWYKGEDGPSMVAEYVYEDERLVSIYYPSTMLGAETHAFIYEGERMVRYTFGDDERLFAYDQDGRLLTSDTYSGKHQFSYEEGMLASIDGEPFEVEKKDGTLEARYDGIVLTYTPMILKEADARKAQSIWRLIFGEASSSSLSLGTDICCGVMYPHALMDTVLMIPRQIYL